MSLITRYITMLVLARVAAVLVGMVVFLVSLDVMVSAKEVADERGPGIWPIAQYAFLKIPELTSGLIKFASLMGGLLTFMALMRRNEMAPIWSIGVSQVGLMLRLAPAALVVGLVQFVVDDRLVPPAAQQLRDWNLLSDYVAAPGQAAWLYVGTDIVRVPFETIGAEQIEAVTIFERDQLGNLVGRVDAALAAYDGDGWTLTGVTRRQIGSDTVEVELVADWDGGIAPQDIVQLTTRPRDQTFASLASIIVKEQTGYWLPHFYATWLNVRLAALFTPAMMLFLIVALAQRFQRTGHIELLFVGGLAYGFGFFIFNGISVAMGESGLLPPIFAGWIPVVAMAFIIAAIALWREVYETPKQAELGGTA